MASGGFASKLRAAGYDGMVIEGRSEEPVYIVVNEEGVRFKKAGHLWGLTTEAAIHMIREEFRDIGLEVAVIGPAGEKLVRFACVRINDRFAGRCGIGAVMGSKNLKAIVIQGSKHTIPLAQEEELKSIVREMISLIRSKEPTKSTYPKYGTFEFTELGNELGWLPVNNFSKSGSFDDIEKIGGEAFRERTVRDWSCPNCPIMCGKDTAIREGPYAPAYTSGPQYETVWALGPNCGIADADAIIRAHLLCNQLGLDGISTGNILGFLMECTEKGLTTGEASLKFGDSSKMLELIRKIAYREGIGNKLAEGLREFVKTLPSEVRKFAMHVKGLELPAYDVRPMPGMALAIATSPRGGCHNRDWTCFDELTGDTYERYSIKGRPQLVINRQDESVLRDSLGLCYWASEVIPLQLWIKAYSSITGFNVTLEDAIKTAKRIFTLERLLLTRDGIRSKDDTLPERFFSEPMPRGPHKGVSLSKKDFEIMKKEYYRLRGWDEEGVPTLEELRELGLA